MKNKIMIFTILLASTIWPAETVGRNGVLNAIALQESGNNPFPNNGKAIHKDGVSYGRYGMTYVAVAELKDKNYIPKYVKYDLTNDWENRKAARLYLKYCKDRFQCSWLEAAGYYHSFTKIKREKYLKKIKGKLN